MIESSGERYYHYRVVVAFLYLRDMPKTVDLTGKRYGKLVVIEKANVEGSKKKYWKCKCDCGNECIVRHDSLQSNHSKSCGCKKVGINSSTYKHGKSKSRIFRILSEMRTRCYNQKNVLYSYYGARGIKICDEWLDKQNGFINFYEWAMSNGYNDTLTIDRINTNGDYEPLNCRWVTQKEQNNNRRSNKLYEINGEILNISQIAEKYKVKYKTLYYRLQLGWDIKRAIFEPIHQNNINKNMFDLP